MAIVIDSTGHDNIVQPIAALNIQLGHLEVGPDNDPLKYPTGLNASTTCTCVIHVELVRKLSL